MNDVAPPLEQSIEIAAPPAKVWALIHDVRRMAEWSPQVISTRLRAGFDEPALGTQFTNRNKHGELEWNTHGEIVRFEIDRELAFRIEENWMVWSFGLEPLPDGTTRLTQRRDAPEGVSDESLELTNAFMGGVASFTDAMRAGMGETLEGIRAAAEA